MAREVGWLFDAAKTALSPALRFAWKVRVEGLANVPAEGGAIIAANHVSVLDSFFVPLVLPRRIVYVGKAEYLDDWKTRRLFPALGMIPIDRQGGRSAEQALELAAERLEQGDLFGIYPEGTRSRDGRLYRGHTGAARLAVTTGCPIIPVGIRGTREVMPPDTKTPRPFLPITIRFARPIDVDRLRRADEDHLLLRRVTDALMFEIRELSGQEYVNTYATKRADIGGPVSRGGPGSGSSGSSGGAGGGNGGGGGRPGAGPRRPLATAGRGG